MDRASGFIEVVEAFDKHAGYAFCVSQLSHTLQITQVQLEGLDEVLEVHGIFTCLVQIEVEIEGLVVTVCGIVTVVGVVPAKIT